ncbi:hypothetical protein MTR67_020296 [Solanum verrucosum]|uniref:J domain-containing protein n=1 Tax=Solanum verrucosum TaxID=315347 RepID=A0AAF0QP80_SOLVR|nr:hypothetical protein MTR67_020296 [Solanum verrucosum]
MMWDEWGNEFGQEYEEEQQQQEEDDDSYLKFDFLSVLSKPKDYSRILVVGFGFVLEICVKFGFLIGWDYYRILEVDYDATEEVIRSNFIRLALKWHPDKQKDQDSATSKFQEINEAYQVLSDPVKRQEYDKKGMLRAYDYNIVEYLNRYKGLILTCNGLGMKHSIW